MFKKKKSQNEEFHWKSTHKNQMKSLEKGWEIWKKA